MKLKFNNNVYKKSLYDIDLQLLNYVKESIQPYITRKGSKVFVPIIFGDPEKNSSLDDKDVKRDFNNKIQFPLISIVKGSYKKNDIGIYNMDANKPNHIIYTKDRYLKNRRFFRSQKDFESSQEQPEHYNMSVVPEYLDMSYNLTIWCEYKQDIDSIEEQISYHNNAYWNNSNYTTIGNFTPTTTYEDDERIVKTTVSLGIKTKIVPEATANNHLKGGRLKPYKIVLDIMSEDISFTTPPIKVLEATYGKNLTGNIPDIQTILDGEKITSNDYSYYPNTNNNEFSWLAIKNQTISFFEWSNIDNNPLNKGKINTNNFIKVESLHTTNDIYSIYIYNYPSKIGTKLRFR